MKTRILKMLRNADGYISGQDMCEKLEVSRTAIWKYMNQLKEDGYGIEAVQNKGYHIIKYPDLLTSSELKSLIDSEFVANEVCYYHEIDSTNNEAKKMAEHGAKHGTLVITECQIGGRGRRGRQWISPSGSGIWMSLILRPNIEPTCASMLTLVAALATVDAITENVNIKCSIKWPNDIVVNGKKICGILTEMSAELDCVNYVVTGIGINVNTTEFADEIKDKASSLLVETERHIKRSEIVKSFAKYYEQYYDIFMKTHDLSGLIDCYNENLINVGRQVKITDLKTEFTGIAQGINALGELIVKKEDGTVVSVMAGEVSVRGLYGYV